MRVDKLTTRLQEALADAQSLAVTRNNPYMEAPHLLAAMLAQADGRTWQRLVLSDWDMDHAQPARAQILRLDGSGWHRLAPSGCPA